MVKKFNNEAVRNLAEIDDADIDALLGAGGGVVPTVSHECRMNTWQFFFTCCS